MKFDAIWAKFAEASREENPPPGSLSAREFADKYGLQMRSAQCRLANAANRGKMTAVPVRRIVGGQMRTVSYYLPKT